jgi:hypothetical protein
LSGESSSFEATQPLPTGVFAAPGLGLTSVRGSAARCRLAADRVCCGFQANDSLPPEPASREGTPVRPGARPVKLGLRPGTAASDNSDTPHEQSQKKSESTRTSEPAERRSGSPAHRQLWIRHSEADRAFSVLGFAEKSPATSCPRRLSPEFPPGGDAVRAVALIGITRPPTLKILT